MLDGDFICWPHCVFGFECICRGSMDCRKTLQLKTQDFFYSCSWPAEVWPPAEESNRALHLLGEPRNFVPAPETSDCVFLKRLCCCCCLRSGRTTTTGICRGKKTSRRKTFEIILSSHSSQSLTFASPKMCHLPKQELIVACEISKMGLPGPGTPKW